jgi:hypothetical protein
MDVCGDSQFMNYIMTIYAIPKYTKGSKGVSEFQRKTTI